MKRYIKFLSMALLWSFLLIFTLVHSMNNVDIDLSQIHEFIRDKIVIKTGSSICTISRENFLDAVQKQLEGTIKKSIPFFIVKEHQKWMIQNHHADVVFNTFFEKNKILLQAIGPRLLEVLINFQKETAKHYASVENINSEYLILKETCLSFFQVVYCFYIQEKKKQKKNPQEFTVNLFSWRRERDISNDMLINLGAILKNCLKEKEINIQFKGADKDILAILNSKKSFFMDYTKLRSCLNLDGQEEIVKNIQKQVSNCCNKNYFCVMIDKKYIKKDKFNDFFKILEPFFPITDMSFLDKEYESIVGDPSVKKIFEIMIKMVTKGMETAKKKFLDNTIVINLSMNTAGEKIDADTFNTYIVPFGKKIKKLCEEKIFNNQYEIQFYTKNNNQKLFPITAEQLNKINNTSSFLSHLLTGGMVCLVSLILYYYAYNFKKFIPVR